jgi:hypothetical protein
MFDYFLGLFISCIIALFMGVKKQWRFREEGLSNTLLLIGFLIVSAIITGATINDSSNPFLGLLGILTLPTYLVFRNKVHFRNKSDHQTPQNIEKQQSARFLTEEPITNKTEIAPLAKINSKKYSFFRKKIEILEANTSPDWIENEEWRKWEAPLDLVRGESYRQKALQQFAGKPRSNGYLVPVCVQLVREPSNKYDPNAIKAEIGGSHVGYIAKEIAAKLASAMDATNIQSFAIAGLIRGGSFKAPSLRVHIWLNKRLSQAPIININKTYLTQYQVSWPPHENEGTSDDTTKEVYGNLHFAPRKSTEKQGYYLGRHYTEYVETIKELKRVGDLEKAEQLLQELIKAVEAESRAEKWGVAPWYYEQLAIIYRKRKDYLKEIEVLERFAKQKHAPGASPPKLLERLEKARKLALKSAPNNQPQIRP